MKRLQIRKGLGYSNVLLSIKCNFCSVQIPKAQNLGPSLKRLTFWGTFMLVELSGNINYSDKKVMVGYEIASKHYLVVYTWGSTSGGISNSTSSNRGHHTLSGREGR